MAEAHIKCDNQTSGLILLSALVVKNVSIPCLYVYVLLLIKIKAWQLTCRWENGIHLLFVFTGTGLYLHSCGGALLGKQSQMQTSERLWRKFIYSISTHKFPVVICLWWKRHESTVGTWSAAQVEFKRLTRGWQAIKSLSQQQLVNVTFPGIFFGYSNAAARGVRKERSRHGGREPQLQRNVSVFLSCSSLTTSHSTKASKQKPTKHISPEVKMLHFKWQEERYKEEQHSCVLSYPPRELL